MLLNSEQDSTAWLLKEVRSLSFSRIDAFLLGWTKSTLKVLLSLKTARLGLHYCGGRK